GRAKQIVILFDHAAVLAVIEAKLFPPVISHIVKDLEPAAAHSVSIDFDTVTKSYKTSFERSSKILRVDSQSDALGSQIGVSASDEPVENGAPGAFLNLYSRSKEAANRGGLKL